MSFRLLSLFLILLFIPHTSYASAVVNARKQQAQQIQSQRQQQMQRHQQIQNINQQKQMIEQEKAEQISDLRSIWRELEITSEVWPLIMDNEPKRVTVDNYIKLYAQKGVIIRKSAQHYVDMIDEMSFKNPEMLKNPFYELLRFAAIVEYDFDNGVNPDAMAKELLGDNIYRSNRQRLGLE